MSRNYFEEQYKGILYAIEKQEPHPSRNGYVRKLFGQTLRIDLNDGFPVITGRKIFWKKALDEWHWMWYGHTNINILLGSGITWWKPWADERGELGPTYGHQIRKFGWVVDQVKEAKREIMNNGRRAVVTFWNPIDNTNTKLPPCYTSWNYVRIGDQLHMDFNIRSSDVFLGLPTDIIIGAMSLIKMADLCNLKYGTLKINIADAHNYENNLLPAQQYLSEPHYELPKFDYKIYGVTDYKHGPVIVGKLNV